MTLEAGFETQFSSCLEDEHSLLRALSLVLGQVKSALLDGLAVDQILQDKQQLLDRLEGMTAARMQLLRDHGMTLAGGSLLGELSARDCSAGLLQQYRDFEITAQACQAQNQALGQLAKRRESFVHRALNALRGPASQAALYSGKGVSSGPASARWLGSA